MTAPAPSLIRAKLAEPPSEPGVLANPGVTANVPFEQYQAIEAVNHSALKGRTMAHVQYALANRDHDEESTDAKDQGSLAHCLALEPHALTERFVIGGPVHETGARKGQTYGRGTKAWDAFSAANPGKIIVTIEEYEQTQKMVAVLMQHPTAGSHLRNATMKEAVALWSYKGLPCKARIDGFAATVAGLDLKFVECADPDVMQKKIAGYGWHNQVAYYDHGFEVASGARQPYVVIAQEKTPPFLVAVMEIDPDFLAIAHEENCRKLDTLLWCIKHNRFPGYGDRVQTVAGPAYYTAPRVPPAPRESDQSHPF